MNWASLQAAMTCWQVPRCRPLTFQSDGKTRPQTLGELYVWSSSLPLSPADIAAAETWLTNHNWSSAHWFIYCRPALETTPAARCTQRCIIVGTCVHYCKCQNASFLTCSLFCIYTFYTNTLSLSNTNPLMQTSVYGPGCLVQVARGDNRLLIDAFPFVYRRHEGRVTVPVAVLFSASGSSVRRRYWKFLYCHRPPAVFIRTILFLLRDSRKLSSNVSVAVKSDRLYGNTKSSRRVRIRSDINLNRDSQRGHAHADWQFWRSLSCVCSTSCLHQPPCERQRTYLVSFYVGSAGH